MEQECSTEYVYDAGLNPEKQLGEVFLKCM